MLNAKQFIVTMELLNARRLLDIKVFNVYVPRFEINGFTFIHSGAKYAILDGPAKKDPMELAQKRIGKKSNIRLISSIKDLLVIALTLDGTYKLERVNNLMHAIRVRLFEDTYKELMCSSWVFNNDLTVSLKKRYTPFLKCAKMRELYGILVEFDNIVNPFVRKLKLKQPVSDFINTVAISRTDDSFSFFYRNNEISFTNNDSGWTYSAQLNNYQTILSHRCIISCNDAEKDDEFVHYICAEKEILISFQKPMNLNGLSAASKITTEKDIDILIQGVKDCIQELKSSFIDIIFEPKK